jgi:pimeloyl-ACP methyl ester carboxylesterase
MLKIIVFIVALYVLACLLLYLKQRSLLFFPLPEKQAVDAEALWLETGDARLKIWHFNQGEDAIIYFGGNAEAIEENVFNFKSVFAGHSVYLVNYRGYGGSSGSPSEQALFEDALAVYDELKSRHKTIHVMGRSLGSGVACYLAQQRPLGKLILVTPYDSVRDVAQSHYPIFPVKWLIKDPFDSISRAGSLTNSILVLLAEHDKVIPLEHSQRLINALERAQVESHMVAGTQHNDILDVPQSVKYVRDFMNLTPW